jgi:hypothetical protein
MKPMHTSGMTQPVERRAASSTSSTSTTPITLSIVLGAVLRSRKSSPPASAQAIVASPASAQTRSIALKRSVGRGNSRNTSASVKPTCT